MARSVHKNWDVSRQNFFSRSSFYHFVGSLATSWKMQFFCTTLLIFFSPRRFLIVTWEVKEDIHFQCYRVFCVWNNNARNLSTNCYIIELHLVANQVVCLHERKWQFDWHILHFNMVFQKHFHEKYHRRTKHLIPISSSVK